MRAMQHPEPKQSPSPPSLSANVTNRAVPPAIESLQSPTEDSDERLEPPLKKQVLDNGTGSASVSQTSVSYSASVASSSRSPSVDLAASRKRRGRRRFSFEYDLESSEPGPRALTPFKPLALPALAPLRPLASLTAKRQQPTPSATPKPSPLTSASRPRNTARKSGYKKPGQNDTPAPVKALPVKADVLPELTQDEREELIQHAQRFFLADSRTRTTEESGNLFENAIRRNTEEERFAPPINVINDIDDEPSPELDFLFSNKIEFGRNVPTSSLQNLSRCNCEGPCDPRSDTCLCAGLQHAYSDAPTFSYDTNGKLKEFGVRTFECNQHCSCSSSCSNRSVQRGRTVKVDIKKTRDRGWGLFAGEDISRGTLIGVYAGEIITIEEAMQRGSIYDELGTSFLFDLDFDESPNSQRDSANPGPAFSVDARYLGNHTRYLNHSCAPNCACVSVQVQSRDPRLPQLAIFTMEDVEEGKELTFDYAPGSVDPTHSRTGAVYVKCACGASKCRGRLWG